ncbi:GNAT family N-acetyltransferase [Rhizobium sp.]|uniref:GNAT family N-acetyltransferase n=1 Tax=Rhizobium sp. TaxID=391 RepID=UPI000E83B514|nr:GNAT family N-acetyltransferase [Rhizobium sp.]
MGRTVAIDDAKEDACRSIMETLPDWFEPDVVEATVCALTDLKVYGYVADGNLVAVMALKLHLPDAIEIALIATRPDYHGRGAGRQLIATAEDFAKVTGAKLMTVKTLAPRGRDEPLFEATRRFYDKNGFYQAEVFPTLWSEDHPCLFMVKVL